MQLRLTNPLLASLTATVFKSSTSVLLSGITLAGVFSTLLFSTTTIENQLDNTFQKISKVFKASSFYEGIQKVGEKLKDWGTAVISTKDDLKNWIVNYLNTSGFKSGAVELYNKLYDWALIVYDWFANKFLKFISNIPEMVKNWKQLRLSLFKWGTFLGGGGGSALWAMFGNADNWGKLGELMGNEEFVGAIEKFSELVDKNSDAFKDMGEEAMTEILERIMEEPKDSKEIIEDLLQEQKEMIDKEREKPKEEQSEPQLEQEHIKESLQKSKGSPQNKEQVFGYFVGDTLKTLINMPSSYDTPISKFKDKAKESMKSYIDNVKVQSEKKTKVGKANLDFLEAIGKDEENINKFVEELAEVAKSAFIVGHQNFEALAREFESILQDKFTVPMEENQNEEDGIKIENIVQKPNLKATKKK